MAQNDDSSPGSGTSDCFQAGSGFSPIPNRPTRGDLVYPSDCTRADHAEELEKADVHATTGCLICAVRWAVEKAEPAFDDPPILAWAMDRASVSSGAADALIAQAVAHPDLFLIRYRIQTETPFQDFKDRARLEAMLAYKEMWSIRQRWEAVLPDSALWLELGAVTSRLATIWALMEEM